MKPKKGRRVVAPFSQPPSGGCVLKLICTPCPYITRLSRLQAAVC
ncbi:hypothetical protein NEIPOLOT_02203 [Neisseria polysaccharea ATCC 43768]|nr:hypothetical protein NEIPOLOT_02203 [Neisseria polysaccharea ATCC 43768]